MTKTHALATVGGSAALTIATVLSLFWPKTTLADGTDEDLVQDGTKIEHVVITGSVVKDPKTASGWAIEIEARNEGDELETAEVETDLTRSVMNASARVPPMPTAVMRVKEKISVAAGKTVKRRYAVTPQLAPQVALAQRIRDNQMKAVERGSYVPTFGRTTSFDVMFKGKWASSWEGDWERRDRWASGKYGDGYGDMPVPPAPASVARTDDGAF